MIKIRTLIHEIKVKNSLELITTLGIKTIKLALDEAGISDQEVTHIGANPYY